MNAHEMSVSGTRCCSGSNTPSHVCEVERPVIANPFARAAKWDSDDTFAHEHHSPARRRP